MDVKNKLTEHIHAFIELKRLWQCIDKSIKNCSGKEIKNDVLYFQLLFSSLDGLIVRLCNYNHETYRIFTQIASNRPKDFSLSHVKRHVKEIPKDDPWLKKHSEKSLLEVYQKWFPKVHAEGREFPALTDFEELKAHIERIFTPIKNHRDTVVAHKSKDPIIATTNDVETVLGFYENLLGEMYFLHSFGSYSFSLGGIASCPEASANMFTHLILENDLKNKAQDYDF